jgi:tetratricopeptide (TPR) repeat protein
MADVVPLLERANLLLAQGRPKDAEQQLGDALRLEPENDYALSLLARCKYDQQQFKEGIAVVQRAIQLEPQEGYYYYLLAFGYYQLDSNHTAQRYLKRAVELNPYSAEFFGLWSLILLEEKDFKQALERANEGLAVDAENITCLNARSTALNKLKRVDDAIETMQNALEKDPENAYTHTTVGWNLLEKGRHNEAAEHFREALRLHPNLEGAREGLKQALKSKIPPYKWLLQYSFWINNKGKSARWAIPLVIYFAVQVISRVSNASEGKGGLAIVGLVIVVLYLLFAATSWFINPLANFFLLFHKDGKYALSGKEKTNAVCTVSCLAAGIAIMIVGAALPGDQLTLILTGLVAMSLGLPLGHMDFPLKLSGNRPLQWVSMVLVLFGLVVIGLSFAGFAAIDSVLYGYGIAFILYTWASAFLK